MRAIWSYGVALLIIIGLGLWMFTGNLVIGGRGPDDGVRPVVTLVEPDGGPLTDAIGDSQAVKHEDENQPDPELTIAERNSENTGGEQLRSVRVKSFDVQAFPLEVTLRGRTEAKAIVTAPAETSGIVAQVVVEKGQTVAEGDLLCTLDTSTRKDSLAQAQAGLDQAKATMTQAQVTFDANMALVQKGLASANTATQLEANLAAAKAGVQSAETAVASAQAELDRTEIRAKVGGVIQAPLADQGQLLSTGSPCATIAQLDPMLFTGSVPEARISLAKTGLTADVTTVNGITAEGTVTYISSVADDATRSFPVEITLPNADGKILDGLTAEAKVILGTVPAHLIPQSVLTLDDAGELGVRSVDDGVVDFHTVTIVSDTRDGVWVLGLPPKVDIITIGQEFVSAGQKVDASQSTEG